jgi:Leu/Phe-tRNA-protein transferase
LNSDKSRCILTLVTRELLAMALSRHFPLIVSADDLSRVPKMLDKEHELCASLTLDTSIVARTAAAGFMPMGLEIWGEEILIVKSHAMRCVLAPQAVHVSRGARRRGRGYSLRIDHDFTGCLEELVAHWPKRWLTGSLCAVLRELHESPIQVPDDVRANTNANRGAGKGRVIGRAVQTHSVELVSSSGRVAGEIGYTCGSVYSSMSGYHTKSGTGSAQLAALGVLLHRLGFAMWDLGMDAPYKRALGGSLLAREAFLEQYGAASRDRITRPLEPAVYECEELLA